MMVVSSTLTGPGTRRLSGVQWNHDGCDAFDVWACEDVPGFAEDMIRSALLRGSMDCEKVNGLSNAINRQLWQIGYVAAISSDPGDRSVLVEVSMSRR